MKRKNFWLIAVLCIAITTLLSCQEEEQEPVVIDSEVLGNGCSNNVTATTGTKGTTLSYESWIEVRQTFGTRSTTGKNGGTLITVTLNNFLNNSSYEREVNGFAMGTPKTSIEKAALTSRKDGYVTITDSVLVYEICYENFSVVFDLVYQTAVFNDGITVQDMPNYPITSIEDNGSYTMTDLGIYGPDEKGSIYLRKAYTHTIKVTCNGEVYDVTANLLLKIRIGTQGQPYMTASRFVDEGLERHPEGGYNSWVTIEQTWSDGNIKTETYTAELASGIDNSLSGGRLVPDLNIQRLGATLGNAQSEGLATLNKFVSIYRYFSEYTIKYNHFDVSYDVIQIVAIYEDIYTRHVMPAVGIDIISDEFYIVGNGADVVYNDRPAYRYDFFQDVRYSCGGDEWEINTHIPIFIYK